MKLYQDSFPSDYNDLPISKGFDEDPTLNSLFLHRRCWPSGSSYAASDLQGYLPVEYFLKNATHKETALVRKTFHPILPELLEVDTCASVQYYFSHEHPQNFKFCCHRNTAVGKLFFKAIATPESVRSILFQVKFQI